MSVSAILQEAPKGAGTNADGLRQPMLAKCCNCQHVWPVAWLPFNAALISKISVKVCPSCGNTNSKTIVMASRSAGDLQRYADWLTIELDRARAEASP